MTCHAQASTIQPQLTSPYTLSEQGVLIASCCLWRHIQTHQAKNAEGQAKEVRLVMHGQHAHSLGDLSPGALHTLWFHPVLLGNAGVSPAGLMPVGKLKALSGELVLQPSSPFTVLAGVTSPGSCNRSRAESCRLPRSRQRGVRAAVLLLGSPVAISQGVVAAVASPAHLASSNHMLPSFLCDIADA